MKTPWRTGRHGYAWRLPVAWVGGAAVLCLIGEFVPLVRISHSSALSALLPLAAVNSTFVALSYTGVMVALQLMPRYTWQSRLYALGRYNVTVAPVVAIIAGGAVPFLVTTVQELSASDFIVRLTLSIAMGATPIVIDALTNVLRESEPLTAHDITFMSGDTPTEVVADVTAVQLAESVIPSESLLRLLTQRANKEPAEIDFDAWRQILWRLDEILALRRWPGSLATYFTAVISNLPTDQFRRHLDDASDEFLRTIRRLIAGGYYAEAQMLSEWFARGYRMLPIDGRHKSESPPRGLNHDALWKAQKSVVTAFELFATGPIQPRKRWPVSSPHLFDSLAECAARDEWATDAPDIGTFIRHDLAQVARHWVAAAAEPASTRWVELIVKHGNYREISKLSERLPGHRLEEVVQTITNDLWERPAEQRQMVDLVRPWLVRSWVDEISAPSSEMTVAAVRRISFYLYRLQGSVFGASADHACQQLYATFLSALLRTHLPVKYYCDLDEEIKNIIWQFNVLSTPPGGRDYTSLAVNLNVLFWLSDQPRSMVLPGSISASLQGLEASVLLSPGQRGNVRMLIHDHNDLFWSGLQRFLPAPFDPVVLAKCLNSDQWQFRWSRDASSRVVLICSDGDRDWCLVGDDGTTSAYEFGYIGGGPTELTRRIIKELIWAHPVIRQHPGSGTRRATEVGARVGDVDIALKMFNWGRRNRLYEELFSRVLHAVQRSPESGSVLEVKHLFEDIYFEIDEIGLSGTT